MFFYTHSFEKVEMPPSAFLFKGGFLHNIEADLKAHCVWYYGRVSGVLMLRSLFHDGIFSTFLLRIAELFSRCKLTVLISAVFHWLLKVFCHVIIGCGARFGPGLLLMHPFGVSIHKTVKTGNNLIIQNSITLGGEQNEGPQVGDNVFIGVGARILGPVALGDRCRIGANAVVMFSVKDDYVAAGNPARQIPVKNDAKDGQKE